MTDISPSVDSATLADLVKPSEADYAGLKPPDMIGEPTDPLNGWELSDDDLIGAFVETVRPDIDDLIPKNNSEIKSENAENVKIGYNPVNTEQPIREIKSDTLVHFRRTDGLCVPAFIWRRCTTPGQAHIFAMHDGVSTHKNCRYDPTGQRRGSWHFIGECD